MTREQVAVLGLAVVAVAVLALMRLGWRHRGARTAALVGEPPAAPAADALGAALLAPVEATYVSTTFAGSWLERVVAHDLGVRSAAQVSVHPAGVLIARTGARDVFVPAEDLVASGLAPAIAGKVVGGEGLVVLRWRLGAQELETGLRPRHRADREALLAAVGPLTTTTTSHEERT